MYTLVQNRTIFGKLFLVTCACLGIILALMLPGTIILAETQPASSVRMEFWYTINYKGEKIGYMHILREDSDQQANAWKITTETIQYTKRLKRITYLAKDSLSFLEGSNQQFGADISLQVKMRLADNKIILTYPAPTNQIEIPLNEEKTYCDDSIGKWLIQQSLVINKSYSLKIIYDERVFNISDPIVSINLTLLAKVKERIMDKEIEGYRVECQYTDETIIPNRFEMLIDAEGNLLKLIKEDLSIIRTSQEDAKAKRRDKFIRGNRTDPFIPTYTPKKGPKPPRGVDGGEIIKQRENILRLEAVAMVRDARNKTLDQMTKIRDNKTYSEDKKDKDLSALYKELLDIRGKIGKTEFIDLKEQIEQILREADAVFSVKQQIDTRAQHLRDESAGLFAQIASNGQNALKKGYFESLTQKLTEINGLVTRPEIIDDAELQKKIIGFAAEVKELNRRAEIIREFYTSRNIKIGGVISYTKPEDISLPALQVKLFGLPLNEIIGFRRYHNSCTVLINGQFYNENTRIDENLFLKTISEDKRILFIYKEEEIIVKSNGN